MTKYIYIYTYKNETFDVDGQILIEDEENILTEGFPRLIESLWTIDHSIAILELDKNNHTKMALKIIPINRISWQNSRKTDFKKLAYLMDRFWAQSFFSIECKWKILSIFLFTDRLNHGYINLDNWYKATWHFCPLTHWELCIIQSIHSHICKLWKYIIWEIHTLVIHLELVISTGDEHRLKVKVGISKTHT